MTFKEFLRLGEDASSSEKGLFVDLPVRTRKPSDGLAFKDKLSSFAGDKGPTGGPGGGPGGPVMGGPTMGSPGGMFMKKRMKKH